MGFKGNLTGLPAGSAYSVEHFTGAVVAAGGVFPRHTAFLTALRFVRKTFFSVKLLLAGSKSEFLSAFLADQGFVLVHEIPLSKNSTVLFTGNVQYIH